ncbi:indoleamine 2,3-dioxygenase 2-like isoform X2 [Amphiura filiformis]|uniref:indoleamine 2,3-dioxygenase 2-like isoform X2 n=1 Tax=Amphiura filiformis TaxID=82378 RepID=UPI003B21775D
MASDVGNVPRLEDYHVSRKFGFLLEDPLTDLPEYFQPWMRLARNMEAMIKNETIREEIHQMPLLDHTRLANHREQRLAQVALSFMMQAYVWVFGEDGVPAVLPKQVAVPLAGVCEHLGMLPFITNMAYGLANWKRKDPTKAPDLENLETIITLNGGNDFSWLLSVYVTMEMDCGPALGAMVDAQQAVKNNDTPKLTEALEIMELSLQNMKKTLSRMYEQCAPEVFYKDIWPYFHGFNSDAFINKGLGGLIYEGVSPEPKQFIGASFAQSSTIQSFDAALGVELGTLKTKVEETRGYMPPAHREFIIALWHGPSIKTYVESGNNKELQQLYNGCLEVLTQFRSCHIQMVVRYLIIFDGKKEVNPKFPNASSHFTEIMGFLKNLRDTTKPAGLLD